MSYRGVTNRLRESRIRPPAHGFTQSTKDNHLLWASQYMKTSNLILNDTIHSCHGHRPKQLVNKIVIVSGTGIVDRLRAPRESR